MKNLKHQNERYRLSFGHYIDDFFPLYFGRRWSYVSSCSAKICMNIWGSWVLTFWTDSTTTRQHVWLSTGTKALLFLLTLKSVTTHSFLMIILPQRTPFSGQNLCDAYAFSGPATTTGWSGIVGKEGQPEVSCSPFLLSCHFSKL